MEHDDGNSQKTLFRTALVELEEQAHELSNTIGSAMNLLIVHIRDERAEVPERVAQAADLSARATGKLQKLMWNLGKLHAMINDR